MALTESEEVVVLQYALDEVNGTELEDWQQEELDELQKNPEWKESYERTVKYLKEYMDMVGEEEFRNTTIDVPFSYDD